MHYVPAFVSQVLLKWIIEQEIECALMSLGYNPPGSILDLRRGFQ